jgi:hypothetical protein
MVPEYGGWEKGGWTLGGDERRSYISLRSVRKTSQTLISYGKIMEKKYKNEPAFIIHTLFLCQNVARRVILYLGCLQSGNYNSMASFTEDPKK